MGEETIVTHSPREYLALVDVESYPSFVAREVDHLDMMAHLFAQMKALTAVAWGAPGQPLNIRFLLTENDRVAERMASADCHTLASGWVRTNGQLCFTSHDRLFDCARHRTHDVLRDERLPKIARPHVLAVPPGVYSVQVIYHLAFPYGGGIDGQTAAEPKVHFTVILRHYPFPAPRAAPVRLPGLIPWAA
jgi:hypothetical protein